MFKTTFPRMGAAALMAVLSLVPLGTPRPARAQAAPPVVSACSGVILPRSVVTDIMGPVIIGVASPIETTVNAVLGIVRIIPLVGTVLPPLSTNATGLLEDAEDGADVTLGVLNSNGVIVGPNDACHSRADSFTLSTQTGLSIGGNRITGLGAAGGAAVAGEINSIAFGNTARTDGTAVGAVAIGRQASVTGAATGSIALGAGASVTAGNSLALGAGSVAGRGASTGYTAPGLTGAQTSAGEVSFGAAGALRQLTNIAPGSAATDAVNVGQLQGVAGQITALADTSVRYTDVVAGRIVLAGTLGATISNLAAGAVSSGSTEAVNGGQVFALAGRLASGFGGTSAYNPATSALTVGLTYQGATYASVQDVLNALPTPSGGGAPSPFLAVLSTGVAASVTGADSVAIGPGSTATANSSAALGMGSTASRGAQTGYAAPGLSAAQISVGEVSIGANGATRQLTHVAAGSAATDAVNVAQLQGVSNQVTALADTSVRYTDVVAGRVVLAGTTGATVSNLAAGAVGATSTEAVNGAQLFDTNARLAAHTTEIADLRAAVASIGAGGGANGGGGTTGAPSATAVAYDNAGRATLTLAGVGGTWVGNLADGAVSATSTDAVNGSQLHAVAETMASHTAAVADLTTMTQALANGAMGPVRYTDIATSSAANGAARTDALTLVGASGGAVVLNNVGKGRIAAGSTDAVNGGQVYQLAVNAANAVAYDVDAAGNRTGALTLSGAAPVVIANVGAGVVSETSTQAVNGAQLHATNQAVATARSVADTALAMNANAVQYSDADRSTIRLGGASGAPVRISNLADGVAPTDAATVQQLNDGIRRAVSDAATYTDMRIALANFQMTRVREELNAGTAGALAAAGLPQIAEPGRGMMAVGFGSYEGQSAVAIGFSRATAGGGAVIRAGATYDSAGRLGVNGGVGWRL